MPPADDLLQPGPRPAGLDQHLDVRLSNLEYRGRQQVERLDALERSMARLIDQGGVIQAQLDRLGGLLLRYLDLHEPAEEEAADVEQLTAPAGQR